MKKPKDARRAGEEITDVLEKLQRKVMDLARTSDPPVRCKKGCSACCYQYPMTSFPESVAATWHMLQAGVDVPTFRAQLEDWMSRTPDGVTQEAQHESPCVFLDVEKKVCRVYEHRPSACRFHLVSSDPALCGPHGDKVSDGRVLKLNTDPFEYTALMEADKVAKKFEVPLGLGPLSIGAWWALKLLTEGLPEFERALKDPLYADKNLLTWFSRFHKRTAAELDKFTTPASKRKSALPVFPGTYAGK